MSDSFEKLEQSVSKIHKRINEIEVNAARKEGKIETTLDNLETSMLHITEVCSKTNEALVGNNGNKGIFVRVDRLEQSDKKQVWFNRAFWLVVLALIGNLLFAAFTTNLQPIGKQDPPQIQQTNVKS